MTALVMGNKQASKLDEEGYRREFISSLVEFGVCDAVEEASGEEERIEESADDENDNAADGTRATSTKVHPI